MHRGRVFECETKACGLEPESFVSIAFSALFSKPLVLLNAATIVLAAAVALLLWLVRQFYSILRVASRVHPVSQAFASVSWTSCWVTVHLHYGIIVWLLRQRQRVIPSHTACARA